MRAHLRLAVAALACFALPLAGADAASPYRPKLEWRTKTMNVDLAAERGACVDREFEVDAAGVATLLWAPPFAGREVLVTVQHRKTGLVILQRTLCDAASLRFDVEGCLLAQGKHFDVHVSQVGRRPCAVSGKLSVQRLMRKD
jgi:hypothetical protein